MKKFLRLLMFVGLIVAMCMLSACGGKSNDKSDDKYLGKWIPVTGEAYGVTLTGEDVSGFGLELKEKGKAVLTVEGENEDVEWKRDGDAITITANGTDMNAVAENDTLVFDNMLDMGVKLTFAKEGSDSAKPENYLPEADKNMIGEWESDGVTDILGDPDDTYAADALKLEFANDHTMNIYLDGESYLGKRWSLLDNWGSTYDEGIDLTWDITEDGIEVSYEKDGKYYVFHCVKK